EAAHGGKLFLHQIGEMPLDLQPYLLRVLEDGEVCPLGSIKPRTGQFRLEAARHRHPHPGERARRVRLGPFYRASVTARHIPPLRDRVEDVPALAERFTADVAERHAIRPRGFAAEVLHAFAAYAWPGNIRELRNVVEAMVLLSGGDVVGLAD